MGTTTTGWHRLSNVTALMPGSINLQAVPLAYIYVTETSSGAQANIYSDPQLSIPISGSLVVADNTGSYGYYLPLNYCVTESISYPNGGTTVLDNISQNGPVVGSFTTTANASDSVSLVGVISSSHVFLQPTNLAASTMFSSTYVSSKSTGSITITHPTTAGATFDIIATTY